MYAGGCRKARKKSKGGPCRDAKDGRHVDVVYCCIGVCVCMCVCEGNRCYTRARFSVYSIFSFQGKTENQRLNIFQTGQIEEWKMRLMGEFSLIVGDKNTLVKKLSFYYYYHYTKCYYYYTTVTVTIQKIMVTTTTTTSNTTTTTTNITITATTNYYYYYQSRGRFRLKSAYHCSSTSCCSMQMLNVFCYDYLYRCCSCL